ncbi:MAG TPA: hypothetical protein GXZ86_00560 [Clostridiales bacterium]|jgi:hypothetical protein|nr:hypothetical protein [Clostridiales bacterium]
MAKDRHGFDREEYLRKVKSGEIKPKTLAERWQEEGIEAFNFTPASEEWKKRMEYFNSEEGLKLWDEAMAEGEEEEQEEERGL